MFNGGVLIKDAFRCSQYKMGKKAINKCALYKWTVGSSPTPSVSNSSQGPLRSKADFSLRIMSQF